MVIAVLIFRFCDNNRKRITANKAVQAHRPYSQYFLAYMIGKQLLQNLDMKLNALTHVNFNDIRQYFEENRDFLYNRAESLMTEILTEYFNNDAINEIDGRTMAAAFRRFDILERYLKNKTWWNTHI